MKPTSTWSIFLVAILVGCGGEPGGSDSGPLDATHSDLDAGPPATDAAVPADDGGPGEDGGTTDGGPGDAGEPDADADGVPARLDCDDADPAVGRTASQPCESPCGPGELSCTDGAWAACSAPTDCTCTTEGAMRTVACSLCGQQFDRCTGGVWEPGPCLYQGDCEPSTVETRTDDRCGEFVRACDSECHWLPWETVHPSGCRPGACDITYYCNEMCMWVAGPCPR